MNEVFAVTPFTMNIPKSDGVFNSISTAIRQVNGQGKVFATPYVDHRDPLGVLLHYQHQSIQTMKVSGPLHSSTVGRYGYVDDGHTLVIDVGSILGNTSVPHITKSPLMASSRGVAELMKKAVTPRIKNIYFVNLENIASDLGLGMLQELGVTFFDKKNQELDISGGKLSSIRQMSMDRLDRKWFQYQYFLFGNEGESGPLIGTEGIAVRNAKLTGASPELVKALNRSITTFAEGFSQLIKKNIQLDPRAGYGNGFAYGFLAFFQQVTVKDQIQMFLEIDDFLRKTKTDYFLVYAQFTEFRKFLAKRGKKVLLLSDYGKETDVFSNEVVLPIVFKEIIEQGDFETLETQMKIVIQLLYFR